MLLPLAILCFASALLSFRSLKVRERRLAAGRAGLLDLAIWTGFTDRPGLLRLDPGLPGALPLHPVGGLFTWFTGHGLCVAFSLAAIGGLLSPGPASPLVDYLLAFAALYQLLAASWWTAVLIGLRLQR